MPRACWWRAAPAPPSSSTTGASASCPALLRPGDVLVRNDTRVIPARAHFRKPTGGRIELLFLERRAAPAADPPCDAAPPADADPPADAALPALLADPPADAAPTEVWEVLARGRLRGGETLRSEAAPESFAVVVGEALGDGRWQVSPAAGLAQPLGACC